VALRLQLRGEGRAAVVRCQNDERVFRRAAFIQRVEHAGDDGIGLYHEVGIGVEAAFVFPRVGHRMRSVRRGEREVKLKRLRLRRALDDELRRALAHGGQDVLELPALQRGPWRTGEAAVVFVTRQKRTWYAQRVVVFDETKQRKVRRVGSKKSVETVCRRPA